MVCPHLEYRREADDHTFETPRAYCEVAAAFVQPMRADICNDRYALAHAEHCEIYRDHESDRSDADGTGEGREGRA
jgi:hypothetical protein